MSKIIVTVDLGHFKAYSFTETPTGEKIELIESYDSVESHGKFSEKFSDANGRFGVSGGRNGAVAGTSEPHNTALELDKRAIRSLAKDINSLILREQCSKWYLAASKKINGQIVENLDSAVTAKMEKNISSDLTKIPKSEILKHFE